MTGIKQHAMRLLLQWDAHGNQTSMARNHGALLALLTLTLLMEYKSMEQILDAAQSLAAGMLTELIHLIAMAVKLALWEASVSGEPKLRILIAMIQLAAA